MSKLQCRHKPLQNSEIRNLVKKKQFNPFAPGDLAEKHILKLVECNKQQKRTTKPFTGRALRVLLIQMQNISVQSSGMCRKQNFGLKSDTAVLSFTFSFLSSFFSFAGHLVGLSLVGNVFRKAFRILGAGELWNKIFLAIF